MTTKQIEVLTQIKEKWNTKRKGTYVDQKISRVVSNLNKMGLVDMYPYCLKFSWVVFPKGATK